MVILAAAVLATSPVALPGMAVTEADYPKKPLRAGRQGRVAYRVEVDAGGVPRDCEVTAAVDPDLDAQTCALVIARQRFTPAHDDHRAAIAATYSGAVNWQISTRMPLTDHLGVVTVTIDTKGEIARCRMAIDDNTADLAGSLCGPRLRPWIEGATGKNLRPYREVTLVTVVRLAGAIEPSRPAERLLSRVSADWTIKADGSVGDCLVVTNDYPNDTELPDPCETLADMLHTPYTVDPSPTARKVGTGLYIFAKPLEDIGGQDTKPPRSGEVDASRITPPPPH